MANASVSTVRRRSFWRFAALDLSQQILEVLSKYLLAFSAALRIWVFAFQADALLSSRANSVRSNVCC